MSVFQPAFFLFQCKTKENGNTQFWPSIITLNTKYQLILQEWIKRAFLFLKNKPLLTFIINEEKSKSLLWKQRSRPPLMELLRLFTSEIFIFCICVSLSQGRCYQCFSQKQYIGRKECKIDKKCSTLPKKELKSMHLLHFYTIHSIVLCSNSY